VTLEKEREGGIKALILVCRNTAPARVELRDKKQRSSIKREKRNGKNPPGGEARREALAKANKRSYNELLLL